MHQIQRVCVTNISVVNDTNIPQREKVVRHKNLAFALMGDAGANAHRAHALSSFPQV